MTSILHRLAPLLAFAFIVPLSSLRGAEPTAPTRPADTTTSPEAKAAAQKAREEANKVSAPLIKDETMRSMLKPVAATANAIVATSEYVTHRFNDNSLKMRQVFDMVLPGELGDKSLVLDFEPKLGDFLRREFVRYPIELRYGVAKGWETYGGITPVSPNPFNGGVDHRWGPGMGKLGIRHDLTVLHFFFDKIAVGAEVLTPLGKPPVQLIDHYVHLRPYITAARTLETFADTTFLLGLSYDRSFNGPQRENIPSEVVRRHIWEVAPGLLYKPGQVGYFGQYTYRHLQEPDGTRLAHEGRAGVIWDLPLERSTKWGLPGKWIIEAGLRATDEEGRKLNVGADVRVRWKIDLRTGKPRQ
jgi:hypothetical protein